jgi:RNA polymerase sigma-70 factor (ECF subfamily)
MFNLLPRQGVFASVDGGNVVTLAVGSGAGMTQMEAASAAVEPDDIALVQAFRSGDRKAFEVLVRRHQRPVWAVVQRFAKDRDAAEDLAQRAFIMALERIQELRGAFRPWLLRIAANLSKNYIRDNARLVRIEPDEESMGGGLDEANHGPLQDEALGAARQAHFLRQAVATLPDRQREVVQLRIDGQLSFAEVGEALGITENNAKVTFHHAVRRLRESLGGRDGSL